MNKKILLWSLLGLIFFLSCEKDETRVVISENITAPLIISPIDNYSKVITEADSLNLEIIWKLADYGIGFPVTYTVYLDSAGRQFSKAIVLGTVENNDSLTVSFISLNGSLLSENGLNLPGNIESVLELKAEASLNDQVPVNSQIITIKITPWEEVVVPPPPGEEDFPDGLWLFGDYQGWDTATAKRLILYEDVADNLIFFNENSFEGFVYMETAGKIKFSNAPDLDHIIYGSGSTTDTILLADPSAPGFTISTPGYYKINVDTSTLDVRIYLIETFGLIGNATSGGWDESTPMTYNPTREVWEIFNTPLIVGALKFRTNDHWNPDYQPLVDGLDGVLVRGGGAITIPEDGNYNITIDFKQKQTSPPYDYLYTVVLSSK